MKELKFSGITDHFRPYLTADLKAKAANIAGVFDATLGDPDYGPSGATKRAARLDLYSPKSNRYQLRPTPTSECARKVIADWHLRTHGVKLEPEVQIEIGPVGSKGLICEADTCFVGLGAEVGYGAPCYPITGESIELARGVPLPYYVGLKADLREGISDLFRNHPNLVGLKLQFPNNPTTRGVDLEFYTWLIAECLARGIWVINDNPYCFTSDTPSILQAPGAMECAIELHSVSKRYGMQGWRFAWAAGCQKMIAELVKLHSHTQYGAFRPVTAGAIEAITNGDERARKNRDMIFKRLRILRNGFKDAGWYEAELPDPQTETLFAWFHVPDRYRHLGSIGFCEVLLEKARIAASPGVTYGDDTRVRFAVVMSSKEIIEATERVSALFR